MTKIISLWVDITLMCINQRYFMFFDTVYYFNSIQSLMESTIKKNI